MKTTQIMKHLNKSLTSFFKKPREASIALIHIIGVDGDLDFLFKSEKENN